jgi:hypothetical protein
MSNGSTSYKRLWIAFALLGRSRFCEALTRRFGGGPFIYCKGVAASPR